MVFNVFMCLLVHLGAAGGRQPHVVTIREESPQKQARLMATAAQ